MATLRDIKTRIRTVREIQKITAAMKMVAVAKLRKVQRRQEEFEPFRQAASELFCQARRQVDERDHPLLQPGRGSKTLLVVFTSDRGLCGAYNLSVEKTVEKFVAESSRPEVELLVSGRKGWNYFRRRRLSLLQLDLPEDGARRCRTIARVIAAAYLTGEVGRVFAFADRYLLSRERGVKTYQLLPLEDLREEETPEKLRSYLVEPGLDRAFKRICRLYLLSRVYNIFLDSEAAEQFARMTSMDLATANADDLIFDLTLSFNKARQEAITKELIDILGGSQAISA